MDKIKFDLINPTAPLRRATDGHEPPSPRVFRFSMLSSLYVAAAMPDYVDTRIVDEDVEPINFDTDADLIGLSFMTYNAPRAYEIAEIFRQEKKKPVIFGGYHPTLLPEEACQFADAICVGDAEPVVPVLMEDFKNGRLKPVYNSKLTSLDGLPVPRRDLLQPKAYAPLDTIQATRGCPYRCTFCSVASFNRYKFRTRPVSEIVAELEPLGPDVLFMDDNITANREYARELFTAMIPLGKRWFSQSSSMIARDPELLDLAYRSGCRGLFVGFESLSPTNLRGWKKHKNLGQDYLEIVKNFHAAGIAVYAGFVFGSDDDTPQVFQTTLDFLLEANVEILQATRMTPFPGTPLYEEMESDGRILDKDWSHYDFGHVVYEPRHMSRQTLDNGVSWLQSHFYSRKAITRRIWRSSRYLEPSMILKAILPLNLGYRKKMALEGSLERAAAFAH